MRAVSWGLDCVVVAWGIAGTVVVAVGLVSTLGSFCLTHSD